MYLTYLICICYTMILQADYLFYTYVFFEIRSDSLFKWVLAALFFHL